MIAEHEPRNALVFTAEDPPSKRAVLLAALRLFAQNGYESTTIRDIAAEAGYTNPALFKFFKSKEKLGVYLFEKTYSVLLDELEPFFMQEGELEDVLMQWVDSYLLLLKDHMDAFLFVHDHLTYFWPKVSRRFARRDLFVLMQQWLHQGRTQGRITKSVPIEIQAAAVSGFFHQCARMIYLGEIDAHDANTLRSGAEEVLLRLLRPEGESPNKRRKA